MKRLFCMALAGVFALSAQAFTTGKSHLPPQQARYNFAREFGEIKDVQWGTIKEDVTKASFMLDDQEVTAFFDAAGDLLATSVSLQKNHLPVKLRLAIDAKFPGVSFLEMYYVEYFSETAYYFSLMENGQRKTYQAFANGRMYEVKLGWMK